LGNKGDTGSKSNLKKMLIKVELILVTSFCDKILVFRIGDEVLYGSLIVERRKLVRKEYLMY
jgi:ABC-type branched-subunit amino acid transport system ATPase component